KAKLRGVPSHGMLCSESEIGLSDSSDGIMELASDAPIGKCVSEWVNPAISSDELAHQITMAGLEVDAVEPVAGKFSGVLIGEVV
ncbi:hypothetical protein H4J50_19305, partial [Colwellia sp. 6M3]|uniref:hypothetical protein n=1 Tax=Colwellia sp. 6M3 TaxID=2759849 RepID=UPI0015F6FB2B